MRHEISKKNIVCFLCIITIFFHYIRARALFVYARPFELSKNVAAGG
jgi:hypothetical protein